MKTPIRLLVIENRDAKAELEPLFEFLRKENLDPQVDRVRTQAALYYKEFTPGLWGLKDIKAQLPVQRGSYNAVLFFYTPTLVDKDLRAWSRNAPFHSGEQCLFIEIPTQDNWGDWDSKAAMHELPGHGFHKFCWWNGFKTLDTMDANAIEGVPGMLDNLEENMQRVRPYLSYVIKPPAQIPLLKSLILALGRLVGLYKQVVRYTPGLDPQKASLELPVEPEEPVGNPVLWMEPYGLRPEVHEKAEELLRKAKEKGYVLRITEGYRTPERQNELYAQGRTKPGKRVTNAKAWESIHQFRCSFDVVDRFQGYNIDWEELGKIGESCGLEWGGRWTGFVDKPHFQYTQGRTLQDFKKEI